MMFTLTSRSSNSATVEVHFGASQSAYVTIGHCDGLIETTEVSNEQAFDIAVQYLEKGYCCSDRGLMSELMGLVDYEYCDIAGFEDYQDE